jgi:hypothetical protein
MSTPTSQAPIKQDESLGLGWVVAEVLVFLVFVALIYFSANGDRIHLS